MKILVVYYSMQGNTKFVAEKIASKTGADLLKIEPENEYPTGKVSKFFWGGKSVVFGDMPKLKPFATNISDYDVVVIGTPIWASSYVPPIKTFLHNNPILATKKVALFSCSMGGGSKKCFDKIKNELKLKSNVPELSLIDPYIKKSDDNNKLINEFCDKIVK